MGEARPWTESYAESSPERTKKSLKSVGGDFSDLFGSRKRDHNEKLFKKGTNNWYIHIDI